MEDSLTPSAIIDRAEDYRYGGRRASYEEFLELTRDNEERYEYIDGEIYLLSSPKTKHQVALTELFGLFFNWFEGKKCRPFVAPYDITLRRNMENINPSFLMDLAQSLTGYLNSCGFAWWGRFGFYFNRFALLDEQGQDNGYNYTQNRDQQGITKGVNIGLLPDDRAKGGNG